MKNTKMRLSDTLKRVGAMRAGMPGLNGHELEGRLAELGEFGDNPGYLNALHYVPEGMKAGAPLVVVLHGCTQSAASYDHGSGWSRLADRYGFALLFPEQTRANNVNLCFNWFEDGDTVRGRGEVASIRAMITHIVEAQDLDMTRIFVTGLSAGGAMANAMLATYPEIFAGGAVIAGVAYGCAGSVGEAFQCMGGRGPRSDLGGAVRKASSHAGPWPRVSVWHGSADQTVSASNGDDIVRQWRDVHGLPAKPSRTDEAGGYPHRQWRVEGEGPVLVEQYVITGMGHGTPLDPGDAAGQSGAAGPHMLDAAISSTDRIAAFFGIADAVAERASEPRDARVAEPARAAAGVQKTIEDALRGAGLMR